MRITGRDSELARLRHLLDESVRGRGGALVLTGAPGVGKSALVDAALGPAGARDGADGADGADDTADGSGPRVLRVATSEREADLAFAGLHGLLWPVLDRVGALPEPQARALGGALGLVDSRADRFLIAAATLTLLTDLAAERPLVVVVDDAQWLDQPSLACLAFTARRIAHDPVVVLMTADAPVEELRGLPEVPLGGLPPDDAEALLRDHRPGLGAAERARVLAVAEGNPLALLELPVPPDGGDTDDTDDTAAPVPVGEAIAAAFRRRLARAGSAEAAVLLLVAAHGTAPVSLVRAAAEASGLPAPAWEGALATGALVVEDGRVRSTHRLLGATAYAAASSEERRRAHAALAGALGTTDTDGERRAWHLAAAAAGPDESVAAALDGVAEAATRRSGPRSAAMALRRSAALSPDPSAAAVRLARAARAEWEGGRGPEARELLQQAGRRLDARALAGASGGLAGFLEFGDGDSAVASALLLRDATALAQEPDGSQAPGRAGPGTAGVEHRVVEGLVALGMRAAWIAGRVDPALPVDAGSLGLHLAGPVREGADRVLAAWRAGGLPPGLQSADHRDPSQPDTWLLPSAPLAIACGRQGEAHAAYQVAAEASRAQGASAALAVTLSQLAAIDIDAGRFERAHAQVAESMAVAEVAGLTTVVAQCTNSLAWIAALRGDREAAERLAVRTRELAEPRSGRVLVAFSQWHRGIAALLAGAPEDAARLLAPISDPSAEVHHPTIAVLAAADAGEAAVRVGDPRAVEHQVALLERWHAATGAPSAASARDVLRALADPGPGAEALFTRALEAAAGADRPFWSARVELLYGEWLRRARRRQDAAQRLARAADTFAALGSPPLVARAAQDLHLASAPQRATDDPYSDELTTQEVRVARLAAEGKTNRAIAAQLFISPRTVGHHLSAVYRKMGLDSRTQLARSALPHGDALAPA